MLNLYSCKNFFDDEIFSALFSGDEDEISKSQAKLIEVAERVGLSGVIFRSYAIYKLAHEPNLVSTTIERTGGEVGESLLEIFKEDLENLFGIFYKNTLDDSSRSVWRNYKPTVPSKSEAFNELLGKLKNLTGNDAAKIAKIFIEHYKKYGYGDMADYRAFRFDEEKNTLVGIKFFETIRLDDLIGYHHQKELLTKNTNAFIERKPANNVLLVGARGTGKSSSVKALVNENYLRGLRLVQITKPQLKFLPQLMETLRNFSSKRFIVFLDDLSFEESESEYKYLKSSIEGGVESLPQNVLIYATSNRRHLIRETWRDRAESHEELYHDDSINETISLSDRFGLIVHYYPPSQNEYLEIIRSMLEKNGAVLDEETLRLEGLRWEMSHSGRNGRTAQQFVKNYLGTRE